MSHSARQQPKSKTPLASQAQQRQPPPTPQQQQRLQQQEQQKQQRYVPWKALPTFCDATGSVSVTTFVARRLPEIKTLWSVTAASAATTTTTTTSTTLSVTKSSPKHLLVVQPIKALESGGCKTSSRHLRRRVRSHFPRKRHRFPIAKSNGQATADKKSRKSQRQNKAALEYVHFRVWQTPTPLSSEMVDTASMVCAWIPTHIWHAKRFHVIHEWNWKIPMMHSNRGAKAAYRLSQEKCLIQDATWSQQPIWFPANDQITPDLMSKVLPGFAFAESLVSGIFYRNDQFPRGAIGPVSWITDSGGLWKEDAKSSVADGDNVTSINRRVLILVHPSIREQIATELSKLLPDSPLLYTDPGLGCLKVRGLQTEACLTIGLQTLTKSDLASWETFKESAAHQRSIHLSVTDTKKILIVCQRPRDVARAENRGITGYDVYCHPTLVKDLFLTCVLHAGACPIGLVEETYLYGQAEPPMPVFPRDYPDTDQGVAYWSSVESSWTTVRMYHEGGGGRISLAKKVLPAVDWKSLVIPSQPQSLDTSSTALSPVIVRGDFALPFFQALQASSHSQSPRTPSSTSCSGHRKRKRRPVIPSQEPTQAPPLSREQTVRFRESCLALLSTLSLPAVLICKIQVHGRGRLHPCNVIVSSSEDIILGFITASTFSSSLGCCQGTGIVSAVAYMRALSEICRIKPALVVNHELRLSVIVQNNGTVCRGSLALIQS